MAFVPAASFRAAHLRLADTKLMWYPNPLKDDVPVRKITVDPFYMDEAEVTNERYAAFVKPSIINRRISGAEARSQGSGEASGGECELG